LGPLAENIQHANVMKFIEKGKKSGAKVITGGKRHGAKDTSFSRLFSEMYSRQLKELRIGCARFLYHEN
jgi:hypothetical protein